MSGVSRAVTEAARAAQNAIDGLQLSPPVTLSTIKDLVTTMRERPLRVVELAELEGEGICGIWLVGDVEDIVLHARSDSELHTQQFVLHELAHMILHHDRARVSGSEASALLPDLPSEVVRRILERGLFDNQVEVEAEILADLLAAVIRHRGDGRSAFLRVFA